MAELVCGTGDRDAWLAARREGITATDLPVILGLVTWDSPFALYWRKKGKLPEVEQSDRMRLGSWLETQVAMYWASGAGIGVKRGMHTGALYRSPERPWQLATTDFMITDPDAVLECKTSATRDGWGIGHHQCDCPEAGDSCEDNSRVPAHVRAQVLWQMDTLGVPVGHVAVVFLPSGEFRSYTISHGEGCTLDPFARDPNPCRACLDIAFMRGAGQGFKSRLDSDDPPPVDGLAVTTDALRHLNAGAVKGKQVEIRAGLVGDYLTAYYDLKGAEARKREAENLIRQAMGDATLATDPDGEVFARREVFKRAGYEVGPCEVDRLVRVKPKEDKPDVD